MLSDRQPEKFDNRRTRGQNIRNEDAILQNEPETVQLSPLNTTKHIRKISTEPEQPKPWWGGPPRSAAGPPAGFFPRTYRSLRFDDPSPLRLSWTVSAAELLAIFL